MRKKIKFVAIVFLATIIRALLQKVQGSDPLADVLEYSNLVKSIGEPAIAIPLIFLTYFLLALVFVKIQRNLFGTRIQKGLLYSSFFGVLWFYGMIEGHIEQNASLIKEIIFGLGEMIPIILMGILLAISFTEDSKNKINSLFKKYNLLLVLCIAIIYVLGRYLTYAVIGVESAYLRKMIPTFLWVSGNGILIGSMYYFLIHKNENQSFFKKAFIFSFLVFGTDWILFNLFAPLLFDISFFDIIWRPIIDILCVFSGILFYVKIFGKKQSNTKVQRKFSAT